MIPISTSRISFCCCIARALVNSSLEIGVRMLNSIFHLGFLSARLFLKDSLYKLAVLRQYAFDEFLWVLKQVLNRTSPDLSAGRADIYLLLTIGLCDPEYFLDVICQLTKAFF